MSVKICAGRGWAWGVRSGSLDVVFAPCAVLGDYLVLVCAGNWGAQAGPFPCRGLALELEFPGARGHSIR